MFGARQARPGWREIGALLLAALLLLAATNLWASGPSLGLQAKPQATARGVRQPVEDSFLREVHLRTEAGCFILSIDSPAPWSHWTLGNPARIIVDLGQTRSRLPNAPGLLEIAINRGVVKAFRTSQNLTGPLDRRVRLTLELSRVVPYEARRVGDKIEISIPDAGVTGSWDLPICAPAEPEPELEARAVRMPAPTAVDLIVGGVEPANRRPGPRRARGPDAEPEAADSGPRPDAPELGGVPTDPILSTGSPADAAAHDVAREVADQIADGEFPKIADPNSPIAASRPTDAETKRSTAVTPGADHPARPSTADPAGARGAEPDRLRTLREALEAVVGKKNVTEGGGRPRAERPKDLPATQDSAPKEPPPTPWGEEGEASRESKQEKSAPQSDDAILRDPALHDPALVGEEDPKRAEPATAAEEANASDSRVDEAPVDRVQLHAANGERLYREALGAWLDGDAAKARKVLGRARRYYPETAGGAHAGFLLRELEVLAGHDLEADALEGVPEAPEKSWLPAEAYHRLLSAYEAKQNLVEVDRLVRDWGHLYPNVAWRGRFEWVLAQFTLKSGRTAEGRAHLDAIAPGDAYEARALLLLAQLDEAGHEDGLALERYRHLAMLPTSRWQQRGLARAADLEFQAGGLADALGHYEDLLAGSPPADEEGWAIYQTGNCLLLMGDANGARLRYDEVAKRFPQSFWAPFAQERMEALAWNTQLSKTVEATAHP